MPSDFLSAAAGFSPAAADSGIDMFKWSANMHAMKDQAAANRRSAYERALLEREKMDREDARWQALDRLTRERDFIPADQANQVMAGYGLKQRFDRPVSRHILDVHLQRANQGRDWAAAFAGKHKPNELWTIKAAVDNEVESAKKTGALPDENKVNLFRQSRMKAYIDEENKLRRQSGWAPLGGGYPGGDFGRGPGFLWMEGEPTYQENMGYIPGDPLAPGGGVPGQGGGAAFQLAPPPSPGVFPTQTPGFGPGRAPGYAQRNPGAAMQMRPMPTATPTPTPFQAPAPIPMPFPGSSQIY